MTPHPQLIDDFLGAAKAALEKVKEAEVSLNGRELDDLKRAREKAAFIAEMYS